MVRLNDPFGRARHSADTLPREERVRLLLELADSLQRGAAPPANASWIGEALEAWILNGGMFDQRLRIRGPAGSHRTPACIAREILEGVQ